MTYKSLYSAIKDVRTGKKEEPKQLNESVEEGRSSLHSLFKRHGFEHTETHPLSKIVQPNPARYAGDKPDDTDYNQPVHNYIFAKQHEMFPQFSGADEITKLYKHLAETHNAKYAPSSHQNIFTAKDNPKKGVVLKLDANGHHTIQHFD